LNFFARIRYAPALIHWLAWETDGSRAITGGIKVASLLS